MCNDDYINGFLERVGEGLYSGRLVIQGIDISPITGQYFIQDNNNYLWLKRKRILEYDEKTMTYKERESEPRFEAYLKKQVNMGAVAYKGEFVFMRFKFEITGIWDRVLGTDIKHRLNLYVDRLPTAKQSIINGIKERKRNEQDRRANKK